MRKEIIKNIVSVLEELSFWRLKEIYELVQSMKRHDPPTY